MPITSTAFHTKLTLNCRGRLLDLSTPRVMGILNCTPDSFFDKGAHSDVAIAVQHALKMIDDGATIIDIGGQSTRPGAQRVDAVEEWSRVEPVLNALVEEIAKRNLHEVIISIDTFNALVAENAIRDRASIINDISAGQFDPEILNVAAKYKTPYVLMHIKGTPETMQDDPQYDDLLNHVLQFYNQRIEACNESMSRNNSSFDIVLDPGFGFGKTVEHNYTLLKHLNVLTLLGYPVMVGFSRKSMLTRVLNVKAADALNGTTALHMLALQNGARVLRVHDVKEAVEVVKLWRQYEEA